VILRLLQHEAVAEDQIGSGILAGCAVGEYDQQTQEDGHREHMAAIFHYSVTPSKAAVPQQSF